MNPQVNWRKVGLFVALTYLVSWAGFYIYLRQGGVWGDSMLVAILYMFVPLAAAVAVQKLMYRQPIIQPLGISFRLNRWFLVAIILPVILVSLSVAASVLVPGVNLSTSVESILERSDYTPEQMVQLRGLFETTAIHPLWRGLLAGVVAGFTVNAVAAFGEELGWRGLMLAELKPLGFWKASLVIGFIWGLWHLPAILQGHNYPENPVVGVFMMILFTTLLAPTFTYVTLKANSVLAAAVFHGVLNGLAGLSLMVIAGGSDLTVGLTGLAGLSVLAVLNVLIRVAGDIDGLQGEQMGTPA